MDKNAWEHSKNKWTICLRQDQAEDLNLSSEPLCVFVFFRNNVSKIFTPLHNKIHYNKTDLPRLYWLNQYSFTIFFLTMTLPEIRNHWENWASEFGTDLRATTKTPTIKQLEVDVLQRAIKKTELWASRKNLSVLDIGCGNGYNSFAMSTFLPECHFTGIDYVPAMIDNAKIIQKNNPKYKDVSFFVGDALDLVSNTNLAAGYDVIFTDRCVINLNPLEMQLKSFDQMVAKTNKGGYIMILENSVQTHARQNDLRVAVGLPPRPVMEFNLFIDEPAFIAHAEKSTKLVRIDDFGTLHDILLYVITPMLNNGVVDYDHPVVKAATELCVSLPEKYENQFGTFGQNRLWIFQK